MYIHSLLFSKLTVSVLFWTGQGPLRMEYNITVLIPFISSS